MTTTFSPKTLSHTVKVLTLWGNKVPSERGMTYEVENEIIEMDNPIDRVCTEPWRKMNIGFAIADALSHIIGDTKLEPLTQFVPGFKSYSTNGRTIDGAYGERINAGNQLEQVIKLLKANPSTRRAAISIYMGVIDLNGGGGLNTPCTLNFHFLVRNEKLNMKVMMRSNDVILGLTNDVFTFTMLHEYVSIKTGIPLGTYTHFASSFHLYEDDLRKYKVETGSNWPDMMQRMPEDFEPKYPYELICRLHKMTFDDALIIGKEALTSRYERNLFFAAAAVYFRKNPNINEMVTEIYDECLKRVVSFWTEKREIV